MDSSKISKELEIKLPNFSDVVNDNVKALEEIKVL